MFSTTQKQIFNNAKALYAANDFDGLIALSLGLEPETIKALDELIDIDYDKEHAALKEMNLSTHQAAMQYDELCNKVQTIYAAFNGVLNV